jgi:putative Mg2+ transporter-C (MgtC) family protein
MLDIIPDSLRQLTMASLSLRFFLAFLFGGIIGLERGRRQQTAGLRTHMMVCIGAVSTMVAAEYIHAIGYQGDVLRLGAQVVSGIGFLGAGTILVTKQNRVRGLTTAASLWASACMGLVIGCAYFECAVIMMVFMLIILLVLSGVDIKYVKTSAYASLYIEMRRGLPFGVIMENLHEQNWNVQEVRQLEFSSPELLCLRVDILHNEITMLPHLDFTKLRELPEIMFIDRM